jgi:hypothetical protein
MAIYSVSVSDALAFLEFLTSPTKGRAITDTLVFTEKTKVSPIRLSVIDQLHIGSQASIRTSIKNLTVTENIHFEDRAAKGQLIVITEFFGLFDNVKHSPYEILTDTLTITELIIVHKAKNATDLLIFTESALYKLIRNIPIIDSINFIDGAAIFINKCGFNALGNVVLSDPHQITLTFGSNVLILRNPEIGDARNLEIARINRKTRGGDLVIYRDPTWPITEVLRFSFTALTDTKAYQLDYFLQVSLGQLITLVDYEGRTWQGIIRSPQGTITQQGICNYNAEFEFEGVLV